MEDGINLRRIRYLGTRWRESLLGLFWALVIGQVAQAQERPIELFAGVEPSFTYSSIEGFDFGSGMRLGVGYFWQESMSAELSASLRSVSVSGSDVDAATALDAAALYHFTPASRWSPFVGVGVHYSRVDFEESALALGRSSLNSSAVQVSTAEDGLDLLVAGGLNWQVFRRVAIRVDARYVPVTISGERGRDSDFVSSVGLGFRF
jgi:opacity protein-like surface antigen